MRINFSGWSNEKIYNCSKWYKNYNQSHKQRIIPFELTSQNIDNCYYGKQ